MSDPGQTIRDRALLARLDRPEDLKKVLAREQADYDCTSCRVMGKTRTIVATRSYSIADFTSGASAFIGLGAYTYWSGHRQLRLNEQQIINAGKVNMAARRLGITGLALSLGGIGLYRAFV